MHSRLWIAAAWLGLLWLLEYGAPFYTTFHAHRRGKLRHDARNLALGALAVVAAVGAGVVLARASAWSAAHGGGLLHALGGGPIVETAIALALIDAWMYAWHRANHRLRFLWRFHRVHHSDPRMNVTTALRFHPGEILLSGSARLIVVPLIGMEIAQLLLYETILLCVVLFHHSNLRLPRRLDYGLLALVVTPVMHRVHHSRVRRECDSNYGSVLPYWDRLFGTLRLTADARSLRLGLPADDPQPLNERLRALLAAPFLRRHP